MQKMLWKRTTHANYSRKSRTKSVNYFEEKGLKMQFILTTRTKIAKFLNFLNYFGLKMKTVLD